MSDLIVIGYEDQFKAEEVRTQLLKLQKEYLIDLEDAVVAVKNVEGKVKLHQIYNLTAAGALSGGFWGSLIGLIHEAGPPQQLFDSPATPELRQFLAALH